MAVTSPQQANPQSQALTAPFPWKQGQMMSIIGETGMGKSTVASRLLTLRDFNLILQTAPDPKTEYDVQVETGSIKPMLDQRYQRILLRPSSPPWWKSNPATALEQRNEKARKLFHAALAQAFWDGGWTVYLDELLHVDRLGLRPSVETLLTEGRKRGITVVSGMQRPVQVTRFALGESRHIISFALEGRDVKEFKDATSSLAAEAADQLDPDRFQFVWYSKPRGVWVGSLNMQTGLLEGEYWR